MTGAPGVRVWSDPSPRCRPLRNSRYVSGFHPWKWRGERSPAPAGDGSSTNWATAPAVARPLEVGSFKARIWPPTVELPVLFYLSSGHPRWPHRLPPPSRSTQRAIHSPFNPSRSLLFPGRASSPNAALRRNLCAHESAPPVLLTLSARDISTSEWPGRTLTDSQPEPAAEPGDQGASGASVVTAPWSRGPIRSSRSARRVRA